MSRVHKVHATRIRQQSAATKQHKPGLPYKGDNFVAEREMSSKKAARKTSTKKKSA